MAIMQKSQGEVLMSEVRKRPLSPHATIYKIGPAMAVSFIHRITGSGLAVFGTIMLLWFLFALSSGPEAYATFQNFAKSWLGILLLIGLTLGVFPALGIRHSAFRDGYWGGIRTPNRAPVLVGSVCVRHHGDHSVLGIYSLPKMTNPCRPMAMSLYHGTPRRYW